jgi:valine--pyruvate aminotransferase
MPKLKLSKVGNKMNHLTGVREIMKDIAQAIRSDPSRKWLNLSPGNPLILPEVESMWREYSHALVDSSEFGPVICRYGATQGYDPFIDAVVAAYNAHYGWGISRENVLITAGSQSLYFLCANLFGGEREDGSGLQKILLPMCPEYTGYDGVVLDKRSLVSIKPRIETVGAHEFRYQVDFDNLVVDEFVGAILLSRPCNPTGNCVTDEEMRALLQIAKQWDIPIIVDAAYAPPFPDLAYTPMTPFFDEHVIHCVSLSKAGLPGERVGFAIAHPRYIEAMEPFESNIGIHSSRFGQALAARALTSGRLSQISESVIKPFYRRKLELFRSALLEHMPDGLPWYLHRIEGTLFAWMWIDDPKMNDLEMYQKLKGEGLICVPGSSFFPGLHEECIHKQQCLRFSMTATDEDLVAAGKIFARVCAETM